MVASTAEKTRETRLRRMAGRQGLRIMKSRARDPRALDYGRWYVCDPWTNAIIAGEPGYMDIDDIERYLLDGETDRRDERRNAALQAKGGH
jgi:hypothetical protein